MLAAQILFESIKKTSALDAQSFSKKKTRNFQQFVALGYLCDIERKLEEKKGQHAIPFHRIMQKQSPLYCRIFELIEDLEIKIQPKSKSSFRALYEFNPFKDNLTYPLGLKDEISWLTKQDFTPNADATREALTVMNFGTYHDGLHLIYTRLIPAPKKLENRRDYFYFIEALAIIQEYFLVEELGPFVSAVLRMFNATFRSYDQRAVNKWNKDPKKAFLGSLLSNIGALKSWPIQKMKNRFPENAPHYRTDAKYFSEEFVNETSPKWLDLTLDRKQQIPNFRIPKHLQKLHVENFSLEYLCDHPKVLEEIWDWSNKLLYSYRNLHG